MAAVLSLLLIGSLVGIAVVPAEYRWLATACAGLLAATVGRASRARGPAHVVAFALIGIGIAGSFAVPIAPLLGVAAFLVVRRSAIGRLRDIPPKAWVAAISLAVFSGVGLWLWALSQAAVLFFFAIPSWAEETELGFWVLIVASAIANSAYEETL